MLDAVWLRDDGGPGVLLLTAHVLAMDPGVVAHRPRRTRSRLARTGRRPEPGAGARAHQLPAVVPTCSPSAR